MTDEERKRTVQLPAAANAVLAYEKVEALGKRVDSLDEKLDRILGKLEALNDLREAETQARETANVQTGRTLDRLDDKINAIAQRQSNAADEISAVKAVAKAALDGVEAINKKLDELQFHGAQSAPLAQPAE